MTAMEVADAINALMEKSQVKIQVDGEPDDFWPMLAGASAEQDLLVLHIEPAGMLDMLDVDGEE